MDMTQLDGLTDWFSRLYGAEAGARMAAACMENGLEKTVVEYGHDPTIKERVNLPGLTVGASMLSAETIASGTAT